MPVGAKPARERKTTKIKPDPPRNHRRSCGITHSPALSPGVHPQKEKKIQPAAVCADGVPLENVHAFTYLGRVICSTDSDSPAIAARMATAEVTFRCLLRRFLSQRGVSTPTRLKVWKAVIVAQLLYGSETWVMTDADRDRIDAFQQRHLRHILGMNPRFDDTLGHIVYPERDTVPWAVQECRGSPSWSSGSSFASTATSSGVPKMTMFAVR